MIGINTTRWLANYLQKLKMRVPRNTGALSKSIKGKADETGDKLVINIEALEYFAFQDQGVSGTEKKYNTPFSYKSKMPPSSAFKPYAKTLGGQFAMAKSIQQNGIKPKNFFLSKLDDDMDGLAGAVVEDFIDENL